MIYGSVCSGIEAATAAWHPLGWQAAWYSEIEKFPSKVLAHHYPDVPNLGDMITLHQKGEFNDRAIELLVGGTPCQSFSVAGLRKGLDDPRGNLALHFLKIVDLARPRWVVWENVPGVASSWTNDEADPAIQRNALDTFLAGLGELGYGVAWRTLDARYFGVPQRRRRIFVVGYFGDWRPATAALFERESLRGNFAPNRRAGAEIAAGSVVGPLDCGLTNQRAQSGRSGHLVMAHGQGRAEIVEDGSPTLNCDHEAPILAFKVRGGGHGTHERGGVCESGGVGYLESKDEAFTVSSTQDQMLAVPQMFREIKGSHLGLAAVAGALKAQGDKPRVLQPHAVAVPAKGFTDNGSMIYEHEIMGSLTTGGGKPGQGQPTIFQGMDVRRLTPRECERLQGFPDDYTLIPGAADASRYRALGNSMAVPVMRWIGERIEAVERGGAVEKEN